MALYTSESKDRVRDAVDFVELVSARTELRRAGPARYEGLCPFHDERTPSFGIDPAQKVYYCFGCQASGDVFTFVQETEGVDFKGALELLAERYGVELEREQEDPREAERRTAPRAAAGAAGAHRAPTTSATCGSRGGRARARVPDGARAGRGDPARVPRRLRAQRLGPRADAPRAAAASPRQELYATGLAQRSQENGRPMTASARGSCSRWPTCAGGCSASARARCASDQQPKYLNTSDNDVYHKGLHLYGADLARAHAARAGRGDPVRGLHRRDRAAPGGHAQRGRPDGHGAHRRAGGELARMAQTVLLALDADSAGQEAMLRAAALAAERKLELRVVPLPAGTDPAELVQREGAEAMSAAVGDVGAVRALPRASGCSRRAITRAPRAATGCSTSCGRCSRRCPPSAMRMELTRLVSGRLALPESLAETLLAPGGAQRRAAPRRAPSGAGAGGERSAGRRAAGPARRAGALSRREETERAFLALCIASPEEGAARARASSTSTSTSRASCCAARPRTCARRTCASRWRGDRRGRWTTIPS